MITWRSYRCRAGFLLAALAFALPGTAATLDRNGDGVVRVAILSAERHPGDIRMETVCADLELLIKRSESDLPSRVVFEPLGEGVRTLMGWFYHPERQAAGERLWRGRYDYLLLAEQEEIVREFPEFHFEGVRALARRAVDQGMACATVVMSRPADSFRDKRVDAVASIVYRVGDGCGIPVIPAAYGWQDALQRNRMTGDSPVKARAAAYLTAAAIYGHLTESRVPKAALEAYWTTKKITAKLVESAWDAVTNERTRPHYAGPFEGVVRIDPRINNRLKIYVPNIMEDDPVRANLQFILDAAFQDGFWRSPNDWYRDGFDRYAAAFDLVYGDRQQMELFLDPTRYTSDVHARTNAPGPCIALYARTPEGCPDGLGALRSLESVLMAGYRYAKAHNMSFIPYPLAWARAWREQAELVRRETSGQDPDWLSYMLANMLYTAVTDRCQLPPDREKPHLASNTHPRGYHETCARIGYETLVQLARLSAPVNALLLRCETYRIDRANPGFVAVRLLHRPEREVRVFCATDHPQITALSSETLLFTPEDYDIEQTVRILPATDLSSRFGHVMLGVKSEDKVIDGANDLRPFVLNFDATMAGQLVLARDRVSPEEGYHLSLLLKQRPVDLVCARVLQHGEVTQEVCFSPDAFAGTPIRILPVASDYEQGFVTVVVQTTSRDERFHLAQFRYQVKIDRDGRHLPGVRVVSPTADIEIEGPAFVTARAEAEQGTATLDLYLGAKRLGSAYGLSCVAPVEQGPPQSRLGEGDYTLRAVATSTNGVVVSSLPVTFRVRTRRAGE